MHSFNLTLNTIILIASKYVCLAMHDTVHQTGFSCVIDMKIKQPSKSKATEQEEHLQPSQYLPQIHSAEGFPLFVVN